MQYRMALCHVVHPLRHGMGRYLSDIMGTGVPVFCRYVTRLYYIPYDVLSDCM